MPDGFYVLQNWGQRAFLLSLLLRFSKCGLHVQHLKGIWYQTHSDNPQLQGRQAREDLKGSFEAKQLEF